MNLRLRLLKWEDSACDSWAVLRADLAKKPNFSSSCGAAHALRFWTGKSRERESNGDSKRWVRHEKGEGEMERNDTHANTFLQTLEPCACVARMKMYVRSERAVCRKMCVQPVSVYTHTVVHTVVATTCVRNP